MENDNEPVVRYQNAVACLREDLYTTNLAPPSGAPRDIGALKRDISALKRDIGALKRDISALKRDIGALRNRDIML